MNLVTTTRYSPKYRRSRGEAECGLELSIGSRAVPENHVHVSQPSNRRARYPVAATDGAFHTARFAESAAGR
jgi:hypothetical protein